MTKVKKGTVLLIDADLVAYRSAAVCEMRTIDVLHKKTGKKRSFSTRTDFKAFLKKKDVDYKADDFVITDIQEAQPLENALHTIKSQINSFKEKFKPDITHIVLSGSGNFRETLPLPKKYKGNRKDSLRPLLLKQCKDYLIDIHLADVVKGAEADDAVIYFGYKYKSQGYDVVISSSDKDANAYSGLSVWDFTRADAEPILVPDLGYLNKTEQGVKGVGFIWYCFQMLNGDTTDHYRPFENFGKKIGDVFCYNVLNGCGSEKEALEKVINTYKEIVGECITYVDWQGNEKPTNYKEWLDMYHKCVRMKETPDDPLCFKDFCKRYGVDI